MHACVCVRVYGTCQCLYMKSLVKILTISYPFTISLHNQLLRERESEKKRVREGVRGESERGHAIGDVIDKQIKPSRAQILGKLSLRKLFAHLSQATRHGVWIHGIHE